MGSIHFTAFNTQMALGHGTAEFVGLTYDDIQLFGLSRGGKQLACLDKTRTRSMVLKYADVSEIVQPIKNMIINNIKFEIESVREKITIVQYFEYIIQKYSH
jgi:hypothetical protein